MKKLKAIVTKKDGTTKEVYVVVDNRTAEMLAQLNDEKIVNDYLVEEYKMFMAEYHEHRYTQSLDKSLDVGLEIEDKKQDVFENIVTKLEHEELKKAIQSLNEQQQKIVTALFFERKTQEEIAQELHITQPAVSQRLAVILERLKNYLKNF